MGTVIQTKYRRKPKKTVLIFVTFIILFFKLCNRVCTTSSSDKENV